MSVESAVAAGQRAAEDRMGDTCLVTAPGTGDGTIDDTSLERIPPAPVTVYEGKCRLGRVEIPHVTPATAGDATWDIQDSVLHLPLTGTGLVRPGCTVTYVSSAANPALEGKQFGIVGIVGATQMTARRCLVREVVSG